MAYLNNVPGAGGFLRVSAAVASLGTLLVFICQAVFPDSGLSLYGTSQGWFPGRGMFVIISVGLVVLAVSAVVDIGWAVTRGIAFLAIAALVGMVVTACLNGVFTHEYLVPTVGIWLLMYGHKRGRNSIELTGVTGPGELDKRDPYCINCGYNLRGLSVESRCPECGKAVAFSLQESAGGGPIVIFTTGRCIGMMVVALLCFAWVALDATTKIQGLWVMFWSFSPEVVIWLQMAIVAVLFCGWWLLTATGPGLMQREGTSARRLSRIFMLLSAVWFFMSLLDFAAIQRHWNPPRWYFLLAVVAGNRLELLGETFDTFSLWFLLIYLQNMLGAGRSFALRNFALLLLAITPISPAIAQCVDWALMNRLAKNTEAVVSTTLDVVIPNVAVLWLGILLVNAQWKLLRRRTPSVV